MHRSGSVYWLAALAFFFVWVDAERDLSSAMAGQTIGKKQEGGITVEISRSGSNPSRKGPAEWFTGSVRTDPLFDAVEPARTGGALVTFEPGARTAWHTHPLGQTLIVTSGLGLVQREGAPVEEIRPGDTVRIPAGVKHWHGASAKSAMSHIAIQEALNGSPVDWLEHVSDAEYGG